MQECFPKHSRKGYHRGRYLEDFTATSVNTEAYSIGTGTAGLFGRATLAIPND